jgi:hypothetical protein
MYIEIYILYIIYFDININFIINISVFLIFYFVLKNK